MIFFFIVLSNLWTTCNFWLSLWLKGHSRQISQGFRIDVFKSSSNFYCLIVSMREVFPENFNFIAQFSLTLWLFKVLGIVQKFLVCKFLWFSGTPTFRQLLLLILLELLLESRPRIVSKTSRVWKVVQVTNFAMFFKLRCLLIISQAQYTSHVFQHWKTIWQVAKTIKLSYHKVVLLLL